MSMWIDQAPRALLAWRTWPALVGAAMVAACAQGALAQAQPVATLAPTEKAEPAAAAGLYVDCRGAAGERPTVVFESGAFGTSADWDRVMDDLAPSGRVCAYDRAGVGVSPPADKPPRLRVIADDLRATLDALGETRPVILVGHSNGALYAEAFARLWPQRVAGLVYVNGVLGSALDDPRLVADLRAEQRLSRLAVIGGDLGLAPLVAPGRIRDMGLTGAAAATKLRALTSPDDLAEARQEDLGIVLAMAEVRAMPPLPANVPVAVITSAGRPPDALEAAWRAAERAGALGACRSWLLDLPGGTHVSPLGRDRAYVVAALNWVAATAAARGGCEPTSGPAGIPTSR